MSEHEIIFEPLTQKAFSPFGDILEAKGKPDMVINQGYCDRYHDLARLDFLDKAGEVGRAGISLFKAQPRTLPYSLELVERHPLGSQAFIPMSMDPFLIIVATDQDGRPARPRAFESKAGQGINFHRNIWHGVLTPLHAPGLFAVIDRIGAANNLQEYRFDQPYQVLSGPITKSNHQK